jgi:rod shape-determining protein MreB
MEIIRKLMADPDIAIDLGTANTRMYANGLGIVAEQPSVVRMSVKTTASEEIGVDLLPLRGGVVVDADAAASLLKPLVLRARKFGILRPRAIATVPSDASARERHMLQEAAHKAGVGSVYLAPEPLAAAIGSGIDVSSPHASLLVDIGDGVTDMAVIQEGELIYTHAIRKACSDLHKAVRQELRNQYKLVVNRATAERLTREIGATPAKQGLDSICVDGSHLYTQQPCKLDVSAQSLADAFHPALECIFHSVESFLDSLPEKVAGQIYESSIHLTGGGACLSGVAGLMSERTGCAIHVVSDPLRAVILGAREMLSTGIRTHLWH